MSVIKYIFAALIAIGLIYLVYRSFKSLITKVRDMVKNKKSSAPANPDSANGNAVSAEKEVHKD